jgi:phage repressor protein C with HTH and peptisase S24 domain
VNRMKKVLTWRVRKTHQESKKFRLHKRKSLNLNSSKWLLDSLKNHQTNQFNMEHLSV